MRRPRDGRVDREPVLEALAARHPRRDRLDQARVFQPILDLALDFQSTPGQSCLRARGLAEIGRKAIDGTQGQVARGIGIDHQRIVDRIGTIDRDRPRQDQDALALVGDVSVQSQAPR
ncbi:MAG: hypothetical protein R3E48_04530 [Burkholderiaceae bacterium]